jgi:hypothetical protein
MLYTKVNDGILFISIEEEIKDDTIDNLEEEIDYMLYSQGIRYYAFNFNYLDNFNNSFLNKFQNKLTEIFLTCGSVIIYGLKKINKGIFGKRKENLYYVDNVEDINKIICL